MGHTRRCIAERTQVGRLGKAGVAFGTLPRPLLFVDGALVSVQARTDGKKQGEAEGERA